MKKNVYVLRDFHPSFHRSFLLLRHLYVMLSNAIQFIVIVSFMIEILENLVLVHT